MDTITTSIVSYSISELLNLDIVIIYALFHATLSILYSNKL